VFIICASKLVQSENMHLLGLTVTALVMFHSHLATAGDQPRNYYKSLGVQPTATDKQIKKAFRQLALKYHPDKSSEPGAEAKFREIAEAYEVLRDPTKRRQYDQMGHANFSRNSGHRPSQPNFDDLFKDFDDLFKEFGNMEGHFKQHFGSHKMHHESGGGSFDFGQDIRFEELFDSPFTHGFDMFSSDGHNMEDLGHINLKGRMRRESSFSSSQSCRTVTQQIGNIVTTYTQCS